MQEFNIVVGSSLLRAVSIIVVHIPINKKNSHNNRSKLNARARLML
jgi:hypothetical protein